MRRVLLLVASVLGLALSGSTLVLGGLADTRTAPAADALPVAGRVVDLAGRGVRARVTLLPAPGSSGAPREVGAAADGSFRARVVSPTLARIDADGYLGRVVALDPARADDIALTPRAEDGLSLRFGGDVMMGRRYFVDTARRPALLPEKPTAADLARPLAGIAPLLGDADLTVVNLETALVWYPWFKGPRPRWAHQEKELLVTSPLGLARALKDAGVDVVDLANNHVYDALDTGLERTLATVDEAGLVGFGAGRTVREAWQPAYVERRGQRVAFVGCTTVDGAQHEVGYVATAHHGGAARCTRRDLVQAMTEARERADSVVFMLHGGTEYLREQTDDVRRFSRLAVGLGALVVVNGHTHVVGGVSSDRGVPVVESAGNLLFDQDLWETFLSYSPRVDLAGGRAVRTVLDPLVLDDYQPAPVTGAVADAAARVGAGLLPGPLRLAPGGAVAPAAGTVVHSEEVEVVQGRVAALPPGAHVTSGVGVVAGEDLLWGSGQFEVVRPGQRAGDAPLWSLGRYARLTGEAACAGDTGLLLQRGPVSQRDVVAAPAHRQRVQPGQRLTLVADVGQASAGSFLELRWYAGASGASADVARLRIPETGAGAGCTQVRFDVTVPPYVRAVQPWLRLRPPRDVNLAAALAVDDVRLVAWSGSAGRRHGVIDPRVDGTVRLVRDPAYR